MNKSLFKEFESVSSQEWKQKIQMDLKGADYNKTLICKTHEGIDIKPFYHPDEFDFVSNVSETMVTSFKIAQTIYVSDTKKSNSKALDVLKRGADSIKFIIPSVDVSIDELLQNIDLTTTPLHFELQFLNSEFIEKLIAKSDEGANYLNIDLIGNLVKSGNWFKDIKEDHLILEKIVNNTNDFTSTLSVNTSFYQNAGANIVQQLAYSIAHVNEYLNHYGEGIKNQINFNVSVGTNYFFEIAKLRALRILWKTLASEYNLNTDCHIFVTPTRRNKTLFDYNTNLLRTTTECMSAILGGADTICNLAYDAIYHKDNEFGERIARNQLLVLKHESYLDKVNNPSDGAYYIESLTDQLMEKALELFKDIENNGGFLKQLKEGTIQRKIKENAIKEQEQFDKEEEILLGTNKHPNPSDKMKDNLELYPFVKTSKRKTLIEPIIENRLAEKLEQERIKTE
ncbi:MAG: methylmalonyl-CoA mutase [Flavobacteriaceae bacterium]|nr:methylmalonyl-CoA mutase [Flavobacteriaceae bacterium]